MKFKELYANFDGLDVSFHGAIDPVFLSELEEAKKRAVEDQKDHCLMLDGRKLWVAETGGRGGYRFRLDTSDYGCGNGVIWWFKAGEGWSVKASVHSGCFVENGGIETIEQILQDDLSMFGFAPTASPEGLYEAVARVDFCMDFLAPGLQVDPEQFIAKAGRRLHSDQKNDVRPEDAEFFWKGRRVTGVTVGKMPGRQTVFYDKTLDSKLKKKMYWFDVWNIDPEDKEARVWRLELRAGKDHLKAEWVDIRSIADVKARIGSVFSQSLAKIRYATGDDPQTQRRPNHPLWDQARLWLSHALKNAFGGMADGVKRVVKRRFHDQMAAMLRGVAINLAIAQDQVFGSAAVEPVASRVLKAFFAHDPWDFNARFFDAKNRYEFVTFKEKAGHLAYG